MKNNRNENLNSEESRRENGHDRFLALFVECFIKRRETKAGPDNCFITLSK